MAAKERPLGVTILAILEIISAVVCFGYAALISVLWVDAAGALLGPFGAAFAVLAWVIAGILAVIGIISLVIAYGLWTGKGWAWLLALIFAIIGLIIGIFSLNIITIVIDAVILYYLTRPHVKAFFGKAPPPRAPPPPPPA